jgi:hypothetical protein
LFVCREGFAAEDWSKVPAISTDRLLSRNRVDDQVRVDDQLDMSPAGAAPDDEPFERAEQRGAQRIEALRRADLARDESADFSESS